MGGNYCGSEPAPCRLVLARRLELHISRVKDGHDLLVLPLRPGERFTIHYYHSVENAPIWEEHSVDVSGHIYIEEERYLKFGAGMGKMPGIGRMVRKGPYEAIEEMHMPTGNFVLRVGSPGVDHTIIWRNTRTNLSQRFPHEAVCFSASPSEPYLRHIPFPFSPQSHAGDRMDTKNERNTANKKLKKRVSELEQALKTSEQHLRQIINFLPDATFAIDTQGKVIAWNRAIQEMTGIKARDMLGKGDYEYAIPFYGDRRPVLIDLVGHWNEEVQKKYRYVKKDGDSLVSETYDPLVKVGGYLWNKASLLYDNDGEIIGAIESIRDITARRMAESERRKSEQKYRDILEGIEEGYYELDANANFTFVNQSASGIFGYPDRELLGRPIRQYMDRKDGDKLNRAFDAVRTTKMPARQLALSITRKDGEQRDLETSIAAMEEDGGEGSGFRGILRDVTDRKRMETELSHSKNFLESIINSSIDGIISTDLHGTVLFSSPGLYEMIGYEKKDILGQKAWTYYHNGKEDARSIMKGLQEKGKLHNYDLKMKKKDGSLVDVILSVSYIRNAQGEPMGTLGIFKDVTEKKILEEELQFARKTESVATLAGGIAHEFNNILMGITGNIELLQLEMDEEGKSHKRLDLMKSSALRMANLTKQLLAYAKGGKYRPKVISLNAFIEEALPIQKQTIASSTIVEMDLQKNIPHVKVDSAQMQMVLSAILANADEAAKGEGRIKITTRSVKVDSEFVKNHRDFYPGQYVTLTIEDHGKGMDGETLSRLFDPFFTTKFQGRGLGMAAVYGIIRNHHGLIFVDSKLGSGTLVRIYLPAVEEMPTELKAPSAEPGKWPGNILLIEDDAMVLEITQTLLERLGYQVIVAATGNDAIHLARTFNRDIDLALLDIKLPDMEGGTLYPLLMEARPDLKVIVCSGYSMDGPAKEILNAGAQEFMQKPFSLATLRSKLDKVLKK